MAKVLVCNECGGTLFYRTSYFVLNNRGELVNKIRKRDIEVNLEELSYPDNIIELTCAKCDSPNIILKEEK